VDAESVNIDRILAIWLEIRPDFRENLDFGKVDEPKSTRILCFAPSTIFAAFGLPLYAFDTKCYNNNDNRNTKKLGVKALGILSDERNYYEISELIFRRRRRRRFTCQMNHIKTKPNKC